MGAITSAANTALRDYEVDGNAASGEHDPAKVDLRALFAAVDTAIAALQAAQGAGAVAYDTLAHLNGDLAHPANTPATVYGDSTPANNGTYVKVGASGTGSWSQISSLSLPSLSASLSALSAAVAAGAQSYDTLTHLNADLAHPSGTLATVLLDPVTANNGIYSKSGASGAGRWTLASGLSLQLLNALVIGLNSTVIDLQIANGFTQVNLKAEEQRAVALGNSSIEAVAARSILSETPFDTSGFLGWGIFDDQVTSDVVDGFALYFLGSAPIDHFDVLVVARLRANLSLTDAPGSRSDDVTFSDLAPTVTLSPSTAPPVIPHTGLENVQEAFVTFAKPLFRDPGYGYCFMLRAHTASGDDFVGILPSDLTGRSAFSVGWVWTPIGTLAKVTGVIGAAGYVYKRTPERQPVRGAPRYTGSPTFSGLTAYFGNVLRHDINGRRPIYGGSTTHAAASSGSAVKNGFQMYLQGVNDTLDHANVTVTQVQRVSDGAILVNGTDYHWDPSGRLYALTGPAGPISVNVSYGWSNERIDLVVETPESGALAVIAGTQRPHTAHEDLFRPKLASNAQRPLYYVRVVGSAIAEIIGAWEWIGTASLMHHVPIEMQVRQAKRKLPKTKTRLIRNQGILVAAYGDSNTQCGGGAYVDATSFEPNRSNAQGVTDLPGGYGIFYDNMTAEADWLAGFTATCPHVTMNGHTRYMVGSHWWIIKAITDFWGYTLTPDANPAAGQVNLLNFGIGATTMEATAGNMGDPARLDVLCNPSAYPTGNGFGGYRSPDLIVIQAGMNQLANGYPDPAFPQQLDTVLAGIASRCAAEVLVYGMHLVNDEGSPGNRETLHTWRMINSQVREVCLNRGVAYMPTDMIQGSGFEAYMGLSQRQMCRPNYSNHPGPYERRKVGEFLELVLEP